MNATAGRVNFAGAIGIFVALGLAAASASAAEENGTLRQIVPGHFLYNAGFQNAGVIVTSEGAIVIDGLASEERGRHVRQTIRSVSSTESFPAHFVVGRPRTR